MRNKDIHKRLKQLEKGNVNSEELPVTIEIGAEGETEIYVEENGLKRYLSDEEYAERGKRFVKSGKRKDIEVIVGEWDG